MAKQAKLPLPELHNLTRYNAGCRCQLCCKARSDYNAQYHAMRAKNKDFKPRKYVRRKPVATDGDTLEHRTVEGKGLTAEQAWASHRW